MEKKELLQVKKILDNEKCLVDSLIPVACFSIVSILQQLHECGDGFDAFESMKLESTILFFCAVCKDDVELTKYIMELERILSSDFSIENRNSCRSLFYKMYKEYVKGRLAPVIVMEVV